MTKISSLAGLIMTVTIIAFGANGKIGPRVLEEVDENGLVRVIVYRTERDFAFEPDTIKRDFRPRLDLIAGEMEAINQNTNRFDRQKGKKRVSIDQDTQAELSYLHGALSFELDAMRRTIGRAAEDSSREGLDRLADKLAGIGAEIRVRIFTANALAITLSADKLAELAALPEVGSVIYDPPTYDELDVSMESCGFDTWWNVGRTGSGTDFGIVDNGVEASHPALSHVPAIHGRPGDSVSGNHGTAVTGIVAMDDGTLLGGAHGLNSIVWATAGIPYSENFAAMEWVTWQAPTVPEVLNFSRYIGTTTPNNNIFEIQIDDLIHNADMLLIKSAGNQYWSDFNSTLTSPGRAYNLISAASMNDQGTLSRNDDVRSGFSSVGPTPDGRRKPDITAPGSNIHTISTGSGYMINSGTSFAAPHTAAAVMLLHESGNWEAMAQKAVLINTAQPWRSYNTSSISDDGPSPVSNWDKSYGWGYLDMDRAYDERNYYITDDIWAKGSPYGPSVLFYKVTMDLYDKATLVWHRRVQDLGGEVDYYRLTDLGLQVYNDADNSLLDEDDTSIDNVHQVQTLYNGQVEAVIKVFNNDYFLGGTVREHFALAGVGGKFKFLPPKLDWYFVDGPVWVHPLDPVTITFIITNQGELTAHKNQMVMDYGRTGIIPADGNMGPRLLPSLAPGERLVYKLDVMADVPEGEYGLIADLICESYGETFTVDDLEILIEVPRH